MRAIVEAVVDRGSFFEMTALYGRAVITGFARLDGWPVALMASDPFFYGGGLAGGSLLEVRGVPVLAPPVRSPRVCGLVFPRFPLPLLAPACPTAQPGAAAAA